MYLVAMLMHMYQRMKGTSWIQKQRNAYSSGMDKEQKGIDSMIPSEEKYFIAEM